MTLLAFLVIIAAIIAFFLDEFSATLKKIFSISWLRGILPLLAVSGCLMSFKNSVLLMLLSCQTYFRYLMVLIYQYLPNTVWGGYIAQLSVLFLMTSLPVWCFYGVLKYKRWGNPLAWATRMYMFVWIFLVIFWVA
jgi:hypothetical protein